MKLQSGERKTNHKGKTKTKTKTEMGRGGVQERGEKGRQECREKSSKERSYVLSLPLSNLSEPTLDTSQFRS